MGLGALIFHIDSADGVIKNWSRLIEIAALLDIVGARTSAGFSPLPVGSMVYASAVRWHNDCLKYHE
jgi:hypothetical protein